MKRRTKIMITSIVLVIIVSNLPPIGYFIQEKYSYQNKDGSFKFTEEPGKGLDFEVAKIRFERFKNENTFNPNKILYRKFEIKPWRFWEWWQIIAHSERFKLSMVDID
jgi:hypothetical protein